MKLYRFMQDDTIKNLIADRHGMVLQAYNTRAIKEYFLVNNNADQDVIDALEVLKSKNDTYYRGEVHGELKELDIPSISNLKDINYYFNFDYEKEKEEGHIWHNCICFIKRVQRFQQPMIFKIDSKHYSKIYYSKEKITSRIKIKAYSEASISITICTNKDNYQEFLIKEINRIMDELNLLHNKKDILNYVWKNQIQIYEKENTKEEEIKELRELYKKYVGEDLKSEKLDFGNEDK